MNVSFLETFYWLGTLKSASAAAKRLRISQPVVSMRMAALHRAFGVELYRGSGRSFELTDAGRRVLAKCEAILLLSQEIEEDVKNAASAENTVNVGITEIIALSWLPDLLVQLKADQPSLGVGIRTGLLTELIAALQSGEIDLALVVGPVNDPTLISRDICDFAIKWVGSPTLVAPGPQLDVRDLARLPIIRSPRASYRYEKMLEYFRWHGLGDVEEFQPSDWINVGFGMMTCAHLAARSVGVTALPIGIVSTFIDDGRLGVIDVKQEFLPWTIAAIRSRSSGNPMIDAVIDCSRRAAMAFRDATEPRYFSVLA